MQTTHRATPEKILIEANVCDERRAPGFVLVHFFLPTEKIHQAIKKLIFFWGISFLSILVPVFHFVTVPLFFFLGIIMARRSYKSEGAVLEGEAQCPHCLTTVNISKCELQWPLTEICQNCAREVRMERKEVVQTHKDF